MHVTHENHLDLKSLKIFFFSSESPSGKGMWNVCRSGGFHGNSFRCFDTSSNFLYINFCSDSGFKFDFESETLSLIFSSSPRVSVVTNSRSFSAPSFTFYLHVQIKKLEVSFLYTTTSFLLCPRHWVFRIFRNLWCLSHLTLQHKFLQMFDF